MGRTGPAAWVERFGGGMTSIAPSVPVRPLHLSRRSRRVLASALVVAAVFVPATSAATVVGPRAMHAVEAFVGAHEPRHDRAPR